jgi:hypothetical protein
MRTALDAYVVWMLRDIDLSPQEEQAIALSKEDLKEMSAPFASIAAKSKIGQKHGRSIIAAADSYESILALAIWMRRVNKIAKRHKAESKHNRANREAEKHVAKVEREKRRRQRATQQPAQAATTSPAVVEPQNAGSYADAAFNPQQSELPIAHLQERIRANGSSGTDETAGIYRPPTPEGIPINHPGTG